MVVIRSSSRSAKRPCWGNDCESDDKPHFAGPLLLAIDFIFVGALAGGDNFGDSDVPLVGNIRKI